MLGDASVVTAELELELELCEEVIRPRIMKMILTAAKYLFFLEPDRKKLLLYYYSRHVAQKN